MAACANGASTASAVTCSAIEPCSGFSACTVTSTVGGASFLQPEKAARPNTAAAQTEILMQAPGRASRRDGPLLWQSIMGSHGPCESLKFSHRRLGANPPVL